MHTVQRSDLIISTSSPSRNGNVRELTSVLFFLSSQNGPALLHAFARVSRKHPGAVFLRVAKNQVEIKILQFPAAVAATPCCYPAGRFLPALSPGNSQPGYRVFLLPPFPPAQEPARESDWPSASVDPGIPKKRFLVPFTLLVPQIPGCGFLLLAAPVMTSLFRVLVCHPGGCARMTGIPLHPARSG